MEILKGLLYINDNDAYDTYGVFLSERNPGDMENYNALLKPAESKGHTCVDFREEDGEKYPPILKTALKARDIELTFTIEAENKKEFFAKRKAFVSALRTGSNGNGWLELRLSDLDMIFKVFYVSCSEWTQLTGFEKKVYASFKVKFREPNPVY